MSITLTPDLLERCRARRASGESLKPMAAELGIAWQRLDKAIRNGLPRRDRPAPDQNPADRVQLQPRAPGGGLLIEKYRPKTLGEVFGQPAVIQALRQYAGAPYPAAFLFSGETGTGKTSAALALASDLGCGEGPRGGVTMIASGEQTAEAVRECCERMWYTPMGGSGWKVVIVNECDRMHVQAEIVWLDALESLPRKSTVVFTTNKPQKLSQRFRDRCVSMGFASTGYQITKAAECCVKGIWMAEKGFGMPERILKAIMAEATQEGRTSLRRAVMQLQTRLIGGEA